MLKLLAALVMTVAVAGTAASQSRLDDILARGTLRVGLTGDYRPFSSLDAVTGTFTGLDVDLADSLATSLGVKLEIVPTKWANLLADVAGQKFDIGMGGISVTLARQKAALFSVPVMRAGKAAIARCADAAKYASLEAIDKPGVRVIVNPGGTNETFDRAHLHAATIVVFNDNPHTFDEIAGNRADIMITDSVETRLQQKLHPELCAIHPDAPFDYGELAYLLPRDAIWQEYVNQWLHLATATGEVGRTTAKWLE